MAYQNVGTPRFYIDQIQYLNLLGVEYGEGFDKSLFTLDPITPKLFLEQGDNYHKDLIISANLSRIINRESTPGGSGGSTGHNYLAILNHNMGLGQTGAPGGVLNDNSFKFGVINNYDAFQNISNQEEVLNCDTNGIDAFDNIQNGCSILLGTLFPNIDTETTTIRFDEVTMEEDAYAGALSIGTYYDMPHSPDLDLSMEIEFDGYDQVQTMGGSTLTNVRYAGSPWWSDKDGNQVEPWSVGLNPPYQPITITKRTGRRNWNLKFSYISDKDLFAPNDMFSTHLQTLEGYTPGDDYLDVSYPSFYYRLGGHDSFIGQVLYKVGNGQKFIFQPDNTNNNPDQFAICQLDQDSLSIKQVAFNVYSFSLRIREVW